MSNKKSKNIITKGEEIISKLKKGGEAHPRLMINATIIENIKEKIKTNEKLKIQFNRVKSIADSYLDKEPVVYEILDGKRLLPVSRELVKRVQYLGLAYQLTGEEKYSNRLIKELERVCNYKFFPDWNPSHFLDTAEMTFGVALGYDWIYDKLSPEQKTLIENTILNKGLKVGLNKIEQGAWWSETDNNWNSVCNGGLGIGALAIGDIGGEKTETAIKVLNNSMEKLPILINKFGKDGSWFEGVTYAEYALVYLSYFISSLDSSVNTDFGLSNYESLKNAGDFIIYMNGERGVFNHGDTNPVTDFYPDILLFFGKKFNNDFYINVYNKYNKRSNATLQLIWNEGIKSTDYKYIKDEVKLFRDSGIALFNNKQNAIDNKSKSEMAFKVGQNGQSHGDLDIGSFIYENNGIRWFEDLGPDDYNLEGYSDNKANGKRWRYFKKRAEGHNTIVINPDEKEDQIYNAKVTLGDFFETNEKYSIKSDLTNAYSNNASLVNRNISLYKKTGILEIKDFIKNKKASDVYWFGLTKAKIQISENGKEALLSKDGKNLKVVLESNNNIRFTLTEAKPISSKLLKWNVPLKEYSRLTINIPNSTEVKYKIKLIPYSMNPIITVDGVEDLANTPIEIKTGESYDFSAGVTATDDVDGSVKVIVDSSNVNLDVPGKYIVTYTATNSIGNTTSLTREVIVNGVVNIPDINLKIALNKNIEINRKPTQDITNSELNSLTGVLNLNNKNISDLTGLEYCTNVTNLNLQDNNIKDITKLKDLIKLRGIRLFNNSIGDISPLSNLVNLDFINISDSQVNDINSLKNLKKLRYLDLRNNQISNISSLSGLTTITTLYLDNNKISDISPLSGLFNLTSLRLDNQNIRGSEVISFGNTANVDNIIKDKDGSLITPLESSDYDYVGDKVQFKNITSYGDKSYTFTKNVTLGSATGTYSGTVTQNVIPEPAVNIQDANLKAALNKILGQTQLTSDITQSQLEGLTGRLTLNNKNISNIEGLQYCINIEGLDLRDNNIKDIKTLTKLATNKIGLLDISGNPVNDIPDLSNLTILRTFRASGCSIDDIIYLTVLTKLKELNLSYNQISDISSLAALNRLTYLSISHNNIGDISPIKNIIDSIRSKSGSFNGLDQVINININESNQYNIGSEYTLENIIIGKNGGKEAAINILPSGTYNSTTGEITWNGLNDSMNDLSYSWQNDADKFSGTVNVNIRQITDPSVLIEIPSKIKMEDLQDENAPDIDPINRPEVKPTVYNMVGAKTPIKLISDPSITLKGNFKIYTDPIFRVINFSNSSDYVPVSVYKDFNSRLTNPKDPLITLNSSNKEKNFIIKATKSEFKGSYGKYVGTINFSIDYSK
ncbi:leucine-rich repeat domain-containing protein [Clostridium sardiniense]|uniref:Leucine-rich repeat domain-containing protein n=2 Tax=Clostridium sardiniense TaxID=29369 RepID=A0ABS7L2E7_CLOSR|nr:leucine-rich repeat domain-containing protein [Clostridium sardiniense]MDQ0462061.1 Leucine-rich repeat (LRR) protein [Clostridium sardiniense]